MSVGHRHSEEKSEADLYAMLGEGDTPKLYARKRKLDTTHDIPYGGGSSVDGKTVYIDRRLYREVMDGKVAVRGMSAKQIIEAWQEHEICEWSIDAGENPVDVYQGAHGYATAKEHEFIRRLGLNPDRYEAQIEAGLRRACARDPENPPKDLWCGPYVDEPTARDRDLICIFRAKGVEDAFKDSKKTAEYGIGEHECKDCRYFDGGELSTCARVSGPIRATRQCDWWERKPHG